MGLPNRPDGLSAASSALLCSCSSDAGVTSSGRPTTTVTTATSTPSTLETAPGAPATPWGHLASERTAVIVCYLDDSAVSKRFAPVVSELQRLWGRGIDLLPLTIDPLQGRQLAGPADPASYWRGQIPQVVVIDPKGDVVFDQDGQVPWLRSMRPSARPLACQPLICRRSIRGAASTR